jgi:hypothetical protein
MADRIRGHVTIEKTGKWIKFQQVLAWVLMFVGMGYSAVGYQSAPAAGEMNENLLKGFAAMTFALFWMSVLRIVRWWCHD